MPKGKGMLGTGAISQALQADIESAEVSTRSKTKNAKKPVKTQQKDTAKKSEAKAKKVDEPVGEIERISITIDKAMLRKIDAHVFSQKQNDKSANRSRFITEAIASAVNKL